MLKTKQTRVIGRTGGVMKHFTSMNQLSTHDIFDLLNRAEEYRFEHYHVNEQLFVANLFYEPSTRTKTSFVVAQKKLGLEILDFHAHESSTKKGESFYDTVKTYEAIGAQLLVVRHEDDDWYKAIEPHINIPMINAGAGKAEHPTQSLLDLLTIYQEFGSFDGLNIVIAGDIKHSRVAHSNAEALQRVGANVFLSAAPGFEDPTLGLPYVTMDEAVELCDVMMLLRIQHERHDRFNTQGHYLESFGLTKKREEIMRDHAIILHPAPVNRNVEIDSALVECQRSRILKQMNNGVYVRMAIMTKLFNNWGIMNETAIEKRELLYPKQIGS